MNAGKLRRASSLNINDTRIAGLYDLEHTIGKGHFAVVKLARHVFTGEKVAVKVIDKTRLDPVSTAHMMQEVRCMKLVQHPNIIRLYEIIDTQTKLFLILELGDYDMYDYIMKHDIDKAGGFKEQEAQQYFNQIIKAIDYCHTLHVVHRDLKPENVIFFEKLGMVKLTDFGFSNLFTPGERLETSCGSLAYSAPEILLGDAYDAPAVDVWSLGVILYMLVCGRLPFQEANESETLTKILDCKFSVPDYVSTPCKNLISRMLIRDPSKRATLDEVVQSPWVLAGDLGHAEALPLIERDHLPESAHTTIIEQMVAGSIGSEDEIVRAIEDDMYNYMTATYYLLAERVLGAYRQEQAKRLLNNTNLPFVQSRSAIEESNEGTENTEAATTSYQGPVAQQPGGATTVLTSRSRSNSWRGSTNARRACSILKEESEEELSSYLRSSSRQSSRNSSPSVSMFGGVSVQSTGIRSSRDHVSPQAIQELLEFSRISGKRAASPDSRISSRSSSPPCSSGRASPAVTAIMSRLKASNLLPSASGMRKLSSSPHLLGICEESEDGYSDNMNANTSTILSGGPINPNRSFISGNSASIKRRGNRSASIGFSNARNSQRFAEASGGDSNKNAKANAARCVFSTSFEHATKPTTSMASSPLGSSVGVLVTPEREGSDEDDVLGDLSPPKSLSVASMNMMSNSPDGRLKTTRLKRDISTSSSSSTQSLRSVSVVTTESSDSVMQPGKRHDKSPSTYTSSSNGDDTSQVKVHEQPRSASRLSPTTATSLQTGDSANNILPSSPISIHRAGGLPKSIKQMNAADDRKSPISVNPTCAKSRH